MSSEYSFHCVWSKDDGGFIAGVPELPGCKADGVTSEEAIKALEIAVSEWIETAKELGRAMPTPLSTETEFPIARVCVPKMVQ